MIMIMKFTALWLILLRKGTMYSYTGKCPYWRRGGGQKYMQFPGHTLSKMGFKNEATEQGNLWLPWHQ